MAKALNKNAPMEMVCYGGGEAYAELALHFGFSNMDPGDFISDV